MKGVPFNEVCLCQRSNKEDKEHDVDPLYSHNCRPTRIMFSCTSASIILRCSVNTTSLEIVFATTERSSRWAPATGKLHVEPYLVCFRDDQTGHTYSSGVLQLDLQHLHGGGDYHLTHARPAAGQHLPEHRQPLTVRTQRGMSQ